MVTCQLCHREYKSITPTHLKKAHSVTMAEYRARFPNAALRDVSSEQRESYSRMSKARWADPDFKAKNAPRLAAQAKAANAALQEKRKADPEFDEAWRQAHADAMVERRLDPIYCADCGDEISPGHTRCFPCYQAWRLEQALHPCENPDCDNSVKGRLKYCRQECMISDPTWIESRRKAGRISQEKHPENIDNLEPGGRADILNRPDVREKQRLASSLAHKGRPKSIQQRKKTSESLTKHWRSLGVTGEARRRPDNWGLICDIIRARDKHCWFCHRTRSKCGRALDVHHINGNWQDNRWVNLIALCLTHHVEVTRQGNVWRPWPLPEELPLEELEPLGLLGHHPDYLEPYAQLY